MDITPEQLARRPKRVGKLGERDVFHAVTKGGWQMVVAAGKGGLETLGAGPHPQVARSVARKLHPSIEWTELAKGDWEDEGAVRHLVPKYAALTLALRAARGED